MILSEQVKQKGPWVALIGVLVMLTQFDKGLQLVSSKWNADVLAGEAKKTAEGVRTDLNSYLSAQKEALVEQRAYQKAQEEFTKQLMVLQQQQVPNAPAQPPMDRVNPPPRFREWDGTAKQFWCCNLDEREDCWDVDDEGRNAWRMCP